MTNTFVRKVSVTRLSETLVSNGGAEPRVPNDLFWSSTSNVPDDPFFSVSSQLISPMHDLLGQPNKK